MIRLDVRVRVRSPAGNFDNEYVISESPVELEIPCKDKRDTRARATEIMIEKVRREWLRSRAHASVHGSAVIR